MSLKTTCPEGLAPSAAEFKGGALECDWIRDLLMDLQLSGLWEAIEIVGSGIYLEKGGH